MSPLNSIISEKVQNTIEIMTFFKKTVINQTRFWIVKGSHWIHEIVSMLLNQTTEYNTFGPFWELNFENMTQSDKIQQITGTRVFHTHLPFSFLPTKHVQNGYKIVYLNRNPKDRFVSHKCFMDGKLGFPKFTWSQYFEKFVINGMVIKN